MELPARPDDGQGATVYHVVRRCHVRGASARHMNTFARLCWQRLGREISRSAAVGEADMQSAQPREIGMLILVIAMFLVLFVVTLLLGTPVR
jgi:hypothetical protein